MVLYRIFLSICFILFLNMLAFSQNFDELTFHTRIVYDVSYLGDSTDMTAMFEEPCYLFIGDNLTLSESVKSFETVSSDTLHMKRVEIGVALLSWAIIKDDNQITTYDSFSQVIGEKELEHVYKEPAQLFDWELQNDTMTIAGFLCQKAICDYGGRKWIAWFTSDIAFTSGPYKFQGLPGLILSVYDSQNHWKFNMREIDHPKGDYIVPMQKFSSYTPTDKEAFFKNKHYYRDNYMELEEAKGRSYINVENRDNLKKNVERAFKRQSNWIELY